MLAEDMKHDDLVAMRDLALHKIKMWRLIQAESADKGSSPDASVTQLIAYNERQLRMVLDALSAKALNRG